MVRDGMCGVSVDALKVAVATSNLYHVIHGPLLAPYAKFDPNWTKNTEVRNFHFLVDFGWSG